MKKKMLATGILAAVTMISASLPSAFAAEAAVPKKQILPNKFYAESTATITKDDVTKIFKVKEWHFSHDKKFRLELTGDNDDVRYIVNDGKQITYYKKGSNIALVTSVKEGHSSLDKQISELFKGVKKLDDYTKKGEEIVDGKKVYHFTTEKAENKLNASNVWVDEETGLITKEIITYGKNNQAEVVYSEIQEKPQFEKSTFDLDLPDNVKIKEIDITNL
ncbi:LolA family protein [Aneurinibacillus migulanus]|uniref:LolA family protein n=1 Tax=Aneurinibacillus migulanus TaxID=47500 RepID=UPI00209DB5F4|nr:outer-membrane lipoprotein carrier protein LolA [Aneurinibacillus migulanus]MCP1358969.1 outer-membrane lipoprotein carrier protein LolA [Aneurinibacillus migulanus]